MPFREVSRMSGREEFVRLASQEGANIRALCRRFEISPGTGYKWLERYRAEGASGLADRSRRPLSSPRRTQADLEAAVLALRAEHPAWGGRKIASRLRALGQTPPSASTIPQILRRHGVALAGDADPPARRRFERDRPNALWQMDFKGHVAMLSGRLHPLTALDDHSRYAVILEACGDERTATVRAALIAAFRRYGLPERMITDNGAPWGDGPGSRWTPLGVFLIEQGIGVSHSRPYHPQTLGKDERFHRTLKAEALSGPPFADLAEAAARLERWRLVYNLQRPHDALGGQPPVSCYQASPRAYAETVTPFEYGPDDHPRRVQQGGRLSFQGRELRVAKAFCGKTVALRPGAVDGGMSVHFRHQKIAEIDLRALARAAS
jgi:transposase InsO family protein